MGGRPKKKETKAKEKPSKTKVKGVPDMPDAPEITDEAVQDAGAAENKQQNRGRASTFLSLPERFSGFQTSTARRFLGGDQSLGGRARGLGFFSRN